MKITVQRISKRTALFTASAVLAVNSLFVVIPYITTKQVNAIGVDSSLVAADVVAINTTQNTTHTDLTAAVVAANSGDVIEIVKDTTLSSMVKVNKALTIDGRGNTVTASYGYTANGVDNAVFLITAGGTVLKNLTTNATSSAERPHGVVVYEATGQVFMNDVTLKNGRAGLINNNSDVTVTNIATSGNSWYGINTDKGSAKLTVKGTSSHSEYTHIFVDDRANTAVRVIDSNNQYVRWWHGIGYRYVRDAQAPTVSAVANTPINPTSLTLTAADDQRLNRFDMAIYKNNNTESVNVWGEGTTAVNLNQSFTTQLAGLADGVYSLRAAVSDLVGKTVDSQTTTFTIDRTVSAPVFITPANGSTVSGTQTVTVEIDDLTDVKKVLFSLDGMAGRTWEAGKANAGVTRVDNQFSFNLDTTKLTDGVKKMTLRITDGAGNTRYYNNNPKVSLHTFTVNNSPVVNGLSFTVHPSHLLVEFSSQRVKAASRVDVALYDASDNVIARQHLADPSLANANGTISSPFFTAGASVDAFWATDQAFNWVAPAVKPAYAIVTVTDDRSGTPVLAESQKITFVDGNEATDTTFASLVVTPPVVVPPVIPVAPVVPTTPESNTPAQTPAAVSVVLPLAINPGAADVLGDSDATQPEARDARSSSDGDVQGATTFAQAETDVTSDANTGKFMGIAWYWWLLIVASVLGLIWGIVAAARNRRDDE